MFKNNSLIISKIFLFAGVAMATHGLDFMQILGIIIATISLFTWLEISYHKLQETLKETRMPDDLD